MLASATPKCQPPTYINRQTSDRTINQAFYLFIPFMKRNRSATRKSGHFAVNWGLRGLKIERGLHGEAGKRKEDEIEAICAVQ